MLGDLLAAGEIADSAERDAAKAVAFTALGTLLRYRARIEREHRQAMEVLGALRQRQNSEPMARAAARRGSVNLNTSTVAEQRRQGHGQTAALGPARLLPCPTCSRKSNPSPPAPRAEADRPLADRLRPKALAELVGQEQLLRPEAPLARMLERGRLASLILWGPPGCGKTTLARLLAKEVGEPLMALSAVMAGVADLRKSFEEAKKQRARGRRPILFIDEIHRFNRTQQDGLLHEVEDGTVTLIGATTENPSFALTPGPDLALPCAGAGAAA